MTMLKTAGLCRVIIGLAIAAASVSIGGRAVLAQPQTCGLLTSEEVQALAPKQTVTDAAVSGNQGGGAVSCRYTWGSGPGHFTLSLSVQPASRVFVGMNAAAIKQGVIGTVTPGTVDEAVPEVGEAAVFKSTSNVYATASAYLKDRYLQVTLDGIDARDRKGQLIALLKSAASRLLGPAVGAGLSRVRLQPDPTSTSQRLQILNQVELLLGRQVQAEPAIVVVDDGRQVGGASIVEVRGVLP